MPLYVSLFSWINSTTPDEIGDRAPWRYYVNYNCLIKNFNCNCYCHPVNLLLATSVRLHAKYWQNGSWIKLFDCTDTYLPICREKHQTDPKPNNPTVSCTFFLYVPNNITLILRFWNNLKDVQKYKIYKKAISAYRLIALTLFRHVLAFTGHVASNRTCRGRRT